MASDLHIILVDPAPGQFDDAQTHLERLESTWSRFVPTSDISRLNSMAGTPVQVAGATLTLVAAMIEAWHLTDGRYDPTILPALLENGYVASRVDPELRTTLPDHGRRLGMMADVGVDAGSSTVCVPRGVALDPGGIGKGLAADLAVARLLAGGARGALVGIGGDLAMAGDPPHADGWIVTVEHADRSDGALCSLAVSGGGGVATSSTRSRRWIHRDSARHHLIDPATGLQSDTDLAAVTVIATTGWAAEAHATAALLAGSGRVLAQLERHGLTGIAITDAGRSLLTDDIGALELRPPAGVR